MSDAEIIHILQASHSRHFSELLQSEEETNRQTTSQKYDKLYKLSNLLLSGISIAFEQALKIEKIDVESGLLLTALLKEYIVTCDLVYKGIYIKAAISVRHDMEIIHKFVCRINGVAYKPKFNFSNLSGGPFKKMYEELSKVQHFSTIDSFLNKLIEKYQEGSIELTQKRIFIESEYRELSVYCFLNILYLTQEIAKSENKIAKIVNKNEFYVLIHNIFVSEILTEFKLRID